VLGPELLAGLTQPVGFRDGQPAEQGYGLGAFVWKTDAGRFFGHAGVMPGYLTQVEFSERDGFAVALQFNHDQGLGREHHRFAQRIAAVVTKALPAGRDRAGDATSMAAAEQQVVLPDERQAEPFYLAAVEAAREAGGDLVQTGSQQTVLDAIETALKAGACPNRTLIEPAFLPLHCTSR
jgi:hypothetical protein